MTGDEIQVKKDAGNRGVDIGFYEQQRGLIAVWGDEAVPFLDGLITNNVKTLGDGEQMMAAFPNAQGRLLAVVRVLRQGERFLFETEEATREKLFQSLFRFTFAGEFFVEDLSEKYRYFELYGMTDLVSLLVVAVSTDEPVVFERSDAIDIFVPNKSTDVFRESLRQLDSKELSHDMYETLRIEAGIPRYGIEIDESTVVPELGIDELISYNKGCYIGQEIIARIHFRGHVAKQLSGLFLEAPGEAGTELFAAEGKSAGRITSVTFSPRLDKHIALGYVRYEHLAEGTELSAGDAKAVVTKLPFI